MFKFARIASVLFTTIFLACAPTYQDEFGSIEEDLTGSSCGVVPTSGGPAYCCRDGNTICCVNQTSGAFCGVFLPE